MGTYSAPRPSSWVWEEGREGRGEGKGRARIGDGEVREREEMPGKEVVGVNPTKLRKSTSLHLVTDR